MTPVVCITGKSGVGKTYIIEGLVKELKGRGFRVATVKHDTHSFDIDIPGKDSWRHAQAGSQAVVISSPQKLALVKQMDHDATLEEIAWLIGEDYDIILAEGYKGSSAPKIEVHRRSSGELLGPPDELLALVTDEPLELPVWQCPIDDFRRLADLIEDTFIKLRAKEEATLLVNGAPVHLTPFVKQFLSRTLRGMVSALKGVKEPRAIDISVRSH